MRHEINDRLSIEIKSNSSSSQKEAIFISSKGNELVEYDQIKEMDFSRTDISGIHFYCVRFINCDFTESFFYNCTFDDCKFIDCSFDCSGFVESQIKLTTFSKSFLCEVVFHDSVLLAVTFFKSELESCNFSHAQNIEKLYFSDCAPQNCKGVLFLCSGPLERQMIITKHTIGIGCQWHSWETWKEICEFYNKKLEIRIPLQLHGDSMFTPENLETLKSLIKIFKPYFS